MTETEINTDQLSRKLSYLARNFMNEYHSSYIRSFSIVDINDVEQYLWPVAMEAHKTFDDIPDEKKTSNVYT